MLLRSIGISTGLGNVENDEPSIYLATLRNIAALHRRLLAGSAVRGLFHSANLRLASGFFNDWTAMAFIRGIVIVYFSYVSTSNTYMFSYFIYNFIIGSAQCMGMKVALCSLPWLELTLSFLSQDGDPPTLDLIYMQVSVLHTHYVFLLQNTNKFFALENINIYLFRSNVLGFYEMFYLPILDQLQKSVNFYPN